MAILGEVPVRVLLHVGAIEVASVILICYGLAVSEGHVKPWLPTISSCGVYPPEDYVFRYGLVVCACLLAVEALALYCSDKPFGKSKFSLTLGLVAAFCLGVVAVVSSHECDLVHTTAAVIFFVLEDILVVFLLYHSIGNVSSTSLTIKVVCGVVCTVTTVARLLMMYDGEHSWFSDDSVALAIVEWLDTFSIVVFQWSFAIDFPHYDMAEVKLSALPAEVKSHPPNLYSLPPTDKEKELMKVTA